MTSTSFNVGMNDVRNSSRVLKPPGGGHSDIFGVHDPQEEKAPRVKNYAKSSIHEVFSFGQTDANSNSNQKEKKTEEEQINKQVQDENETPKPPISTPQRTRVPPGGFSSAFW